MKKRERERENAKTQKAKQESRIDKLAFPLAADRTSLERHYSRSKRIRTAIYRWLLENEGEQFDDIADMAEQAANTARCASETAARWISQYCSQTGDFGFTREEHGFFRKTGK